MSQCVWNLWHRAWHTGSAHYYPCDQSHSLGRICSKNTFLQSLKTLGIEDHNLPLTWREKILLRKFSTALKELNIGNTTYHLEPTLTFCCAYFIHFSSSSHFPSPFYSSLFPANILDVLQNCRDQHTPPVSTSVCVSLTGVLYISTCFCNVNYFDQLLTLEFLAFPNLILVVKVWDTAKCASSSFLPWHSVDPQVHTYSLSYQMWTW